MKKILFVAATLAVFGPWRPAFAGQRVYGGQPFNTTCVAATSTSTAINMDRIDGISFQAVYSDTTPATVAIASTSFAVAGSTVANVATLGCAGQGTWLSTSGGLPSGLSAGTTYYVFQNAAGTWSLSATSTGAVAGLAVSWTTQGTGTHTFHFLANSGNSVRFQVSNDGSNWTDVASSSTTFSGANTTTWNYAQTYYRWVRAVYNAVTGSYNLVITANGESLTAGQ
jgi:hypothetical protein